MGAILDYRGSRPVDLNVGGEILDPERVAQLAQVESELYNDKMIALLHYMTGVHAKGRDYSNFMIAAGYAAFLALWSAVAKDIAVEYRLLSGGLIAVSLVAFISWEIAKMVWLMNEGPIIERAMTTPGTRADLALEIQRAYDEIEVRNHTLNGLWPLPFYISLSTGLTGGALLAIACLSTGGYLALN